MLEKHQYYNLARLPYVVQHYMSLVPWLGLVSPTLVAPVWPRIVVIEKYRHWRQARWLMSCCMQPSDLPSTPAIWFDPVSQTHLVQVYQTLLSAECKTCSSDGAALSATDDLSHRTKLWWYHTLHNVLQSIRPSTTVPNQRHHPGPWNC